MINFLIVLQKGLLFVNPKDEIVLTVYDSIQNSLDQISIDYNDDYRQYLLRTLLPNVLFNEVLVFSEGQLVYMILMDFLRLTGFTVVLSVRNHYHFKLLKFYTYQKISKTWEKKILSMSSI